MPELLTIGYEGVAQTALFQTLVYHDVQTLLDIRELPQSRKPGLSKTALGLAATDYGLQYAHIRALGTPRDIRHRRRIDHDEAAFREGFLDYLATQDEAMGALVARVGRERCCLMCYEAEARECHRWFVAGRAAEMMAGAGGEPLTVTHLKIAPLAPNSGGTGEEPGQATVPSGSPSGAVAPGLGRGGHPDAFRHSL